MCVGAFIKETSCVTNRFNSECTYISVCGLISALASIAHLYTRNGLFTPKEPQQPAPRPKRAEWGLFLTNNRNAVHCVCRNTDTGDKTLQEPAKSLTKTVDLFV
jgi:hypothetical protein